MLLTMLFLSDIQSQQQRESSGSRVYNTKARGGRVPGLKSAHAKTAGAGDTQEAHQGGCAPLSREAKVPVAVCSLGYG